MNRKQRNTRLFGSRGSPFAPRKCVAIYGSATSRKDLTQPRLVACLVLKTATRNDYRGVCELLTLSPALREAIGLNKVPRFITLGKFASKSGIMEIVDAMIGQTLADAGIRVIPGEITVDSTGMLNGAAGAHYQIRAGGSGRTRRKPVKVSAAIVRGAMPPAALVVGMGSSADMKQTPALMDQIEARTKPVRLMADKGYDAEWAHEASRERRGAESLIPPVPRAHDGSVRTKWRSKMVALPKAFGRRRRAESFFSGMKRTMLATLSSRSERTMLVEAALKALAYAIRRQDRPRRREGVYRALGEPCHPETCQPGVVRCNNAEPGCPRRGRWS